MVKALSVSRGSFYWHFDDIKGFHAALIAAWRVQINEEVIAQLRQLPDAKDQIKALMVRVFTMSRPLELGIIWAGVDPLVFQTLADVDKVRQSYAQALLQTIDLPPAIAQSRAQMMMWVYVGHALSTVDVDDPEACAADFTRILTTQVET
ncbi:TetR/AcrR family transcriptional regulator [Ascidiaceihabitans sp.]|uniref:TetR/AcrR family transcriptional regulator n=1 Tax=Ascidiaceihabitans sp. TaxID=1872644 RepID=UPI0032988B22